MKLLAAVGASVAAATLSHRVISGGPKRKSNVIDSEMEKHRSERRSVARKTLDAYVRVDTPSLLSAIPRDSVMRAGIEQLCGDAAEFSNSIESPTIKYREYNHSRLLTYAVNGTVDRWRVSVADADLDQWPEVYRPSDQIVIDAEDPDGLPVRVEVVRPLETNVRAMPKQDPTYCVVKVKNYSTKAQRVWKLLVVREWYAVCMSRSAGERAPTDSFTFAKIIGIIGSVKVPFQSHPDLVESTSLAAFLSRSAYLWRQSRMGIKPMRN
jgi:hypothetical protein